LTNLGLTPGDVARSGAVQAVRRNLCAILALRAQTNYITDFRFAKKRQLPVIAANVPRRAAAAVAEANEVSSLVLGEDARFVPDVVHYDSAEYYERFTEMMTQMASSAPMKSKNVEGLYRAQVVKDAVMAASLEPFLGRPILFCCGCFHCDFHLGIPYQLHRNHPELKMAVVTFAALLENAPMSDRSRVGDYIWIVE